MSNARKTLHAALVRPKKIPSPTASAVVVWTLVVGLSQVDLIENAWVFPPVLCALAAVALVFGHRSGWYVMAVGSFLWGFGEFMTMLQDGVTRTSGVATIAGVPVFALLYARATVDYVFGEAAR